jgi:hypothetical protein
MINTNPQTKVSYFFTVTNLEYTHYGLAVVQINDTEYAIATSQEKVELACREYIRDSLWEFNPEFLVDYIPNTSDRLIESLKRLQVSVCKDCNDLILAAVGDNFEKLVEDAIAINGANNLLSPYDGLEWPITEVTRDLMNTSNFLLNWELFTLLKSALDLPKGVTKEDLTFFAL